MEIRNLISFAQVAELNSFTKAARLLGYSQSTISFQIKQLEDELGCLLFERINHTISLTEKGKELLEYAQKIGRMTDEFNQHINEEGTPDGSLHILAPDSICEDMMNENYKEFHETYPGISLKFTTADTKEMRNMLDRNMADVMLTLDEHIYRNDYVIAKEEPVAMHFVTGSGSPYAKLGKISIKDVAKLPFILTEENAGYRRALENAFAKNSLDVNPILEIGRTDVINSVLESGIGISFLPDFVTRRGFEAGKLAYLDVTDVKFDIWKQLIYHKNKWLSRSLDALIKFIITHEFKNV